MVSGRHFDTKAMGLTSPVRYCLLALATIACTPEKGYNGEFKPEVDYEIVSIINRREPEATPCAVASSDKWPSGQLTTEQAQQLFASKVLSHSARSGGGNWALLEIDRQTVDAAIAMSAGADVIGVRELRAKADRQLFRDRARSFLLMPAEPGLWVLGAEEPLLVTQRNGTGRLVGMSVGAALGLTPGSLAPLQFEDLTCRSDAGYGVDIRYRDRFENNFFLGARYWKASFVFGGDSNLLPVLASVFAQHVPSVDPAGPSSGSAPYVDGLSWSDVLNLGQFAASILSFLVKL